MSVSSLPTVPTSATTTVTKIKPEYIEIEALRYLNGPAADKANELLGLLEGVWATSTRAQVNAHLVNLGAPTVDAKVLQSCHGLKEKVAKVASERVIASTSPLTTDIHAIVHSQVNAVINEIEAKYLSKTDFNEDFIMQNALLKNLPITLDIEATRLLEKITRDAKALLNTEVLKTSLEFTHESPAQRILKVEEVLQKLARDGTEVGSIVTDLNQLKAKEDVKKWLDKINDLQKTSDDLHHALYTLHEVARHGFKNFWTRSNQAVLLPSETDKLFTALKSIHWDGFEAYKKSIAESSSGSFEYLQSLLQGVKSSDSAKYQKALNDARLTDAEFEKFFLVYFVRERLDTAKLAFDAKKREVLGVNERVFEQDVNKWRGMMRERIVHHYNELSDSAKQFPHSTNYALTEEEKLHYESLNGYFENFQSLFYGIENDKAQGETVTKALKLILDYRAPRTTEKARTATAKALSEYNELQNQFYHNDRNPLQQEEGGFQRVLKTVGRIETGREAVKSAISGPLNAFGRFAESATKTLLKWGSGAAKGVTGFAGSQLASVNAFTEKDVEGKWALTRGLKRLAKTPLYLLWPATKLTEKVSTGTSNIIGKAQGVVAKGYEDLLQVVRDTAGAPEINHLFQALTYGVDAATELTGKAIGGISNWGYEHLNTAQKREILAAFYEAAENEEDLRKAVESADLAKALDFRWKSPNFKPNPEVQDMDFDNTKSATNVVQSTSNLVTNILAPIETWWAFRTVDRLIQRWTARAATNESIKTILWNKNIQPKINDVLILGTATPGEYLRVKIKEIDISTQKIKADLWSASANRSNQYKKKDMVIKINTDNKLIFGKTSQQEYEFTTVRLFECKNNTYSETSL